MWRYFTYNFQILFSVNLAKNSFFLDNTFKTVNFEQGKDISILINSFNSRECWNKTDILIEKA